MLNLDDSIDNILEGGAPVVVTSIFAQPVASLLPTCRTVAFLEAHSHPTLLAFLGGSVATYARATLVVAG